MQIEKFCWCISLVRRRISSCLRRASQQKQPCVYIFPAGPAAGLLSQNNNNNTAASLSMHGCDLRPIPHPRLLCLLSPCTISLSIPRQRRRRRSKKVPIYERTEKEGERERKTLFLHAQESQSLLASRKSECMSFPAFPVFRTLSLLHYIAVTAILVMASSFCRAREREREREPLSEYQLARSLVRGGPKKG